MTGSTRYVKFALYNAGSLNTGHDDFVIAMSRLSPDLIAINETWLRAGQEARAPAVPGYRLRNAARPVHVRGGRGGGVAFYVKNDLRVRFHKSPDNGIEQLWLSLRLNGHSIIVGTAYRPPWQNIDMFLDALTDSVTYFSHNDYVVLMGDFNINILERASSNCERLVQFLQCMNLQQVVTEPTHFSVDTETLIDLVCTNARVRDVKVDNITGSLGHAMIVTEIFFKKIKINPKIIMYRPIKNINLTLFNSDLNSLDWESLFTCATVDDMVSDFNTMLISLFDRHAPVKTIKLREEHTLPWITDNIKYLMHLRNEAHRRFRKTRSDKDKNYYRDLKSLFSASVHLEKQAYFNDLVNSKVINSKSFWKNIKQKILVDPSKNDYLPEHFDDPDAINNHFLKLPSSDSIRVIDLSFYNHNKFGTSLFRLHEISESDIAKYILSVKSSAIGNDDISKDMVIFTCPRTLPVITEIVNRSIRTGQVPKQWKEAIVKPLPKIDVPLELKDLRPISILPFLSKIIEKAVSAQLYDYVERNNILPQLQSGFRKGRGTVTALLDVVDNILAEQDVGKGTILSLLDFSRAFDSLSVPLLISKLSYYGVEQDSLKWFESYLTDRFQFVRLSKRDGSHMSSQRCRVTRGVPQGSVLGPLLFLIYCADLVKVIKHCRYHCYADDVQIYISELPKNKLSAQAKINEDLDRVAEWSDRNALVLNPSKSKYMILGTKTQIKKFSEQPLSIQILGQPIECVTEAKNLGIVIDSQLRFEAHVANLVKSCFYRLKVLYKIRHLLCENARITLCEALILSRLNYGDILYGPRLLSKTQRIIQRIQNACCRFCFSIPPRTHISPYLNKAGMLKMESRRRLHLACLMFDVFKFKKPDYLHDKLKYHSAFLARYSNRYMRLPLAYHNHKTAAFEGSFRYRATKCWNTIPPPIRQMKTRHTFKKYFFTYLLQEQITQCSAL